MTRGNRHRLRSLGIPLVTLVLLMCMLAFGGLSQDPPTGAPDYFARVAAKMDEVPFRVGAWFGVNLPYTDVEVEMLRPNKMLQRTYQDQATGQKASLSIVHCTDVRDMGGHYPPVCYPAHGWNLESSELSEVTVQGRPQSVRVYVFSRMNRGTREAIRIVSFFIIPNSSDIRSERDGLERAAKRPQAAGLGAAQVQILTPDSQSIETTDEMLSKLIEVVEPVIETVQEGVK